MSSIDSNSGGNRLQRLKQLLARIEQLPPSEERDRILSEVRARAVDVDTGETPRAMLPVDPAVLPPIVLAKARLAAPRTSFVAPYKPRIVGPILPATPPSAPPTERPMVELLSSTSGCAWRRRLRLTPTRRDPGNAACAVSQPSTLRTAAPMRSSLGIAAVSRFFAYGSGTSAMPTRSTGASRSSKQALEIRAASSAVTP